MTSTPVQSCPGSDDGPAALQQLLGTPLAIWNRQACGRWELERRSTCASDDESAAVARLSSSFDALDELLDKACEDREPCSAESSPGNHLIAIPLTRQRRVVNRIAVAAFAADHASHIVRLAEAARICLDQREELRSLTEANHDFLQQVSSDFEELAFLRSLAERLALGSVTADLTELTKYSLPPLGKATGAETLYYVEGRSGEPARVADSWEAPGYAGSRAATALVERLVERFRRASGKNPVIKNHVHETELASLLPGVRGFLLVPLATSLGSVGWLLALNRRNDCQVAHRTSICAASYDEFGTSEASLMGTAAAMIASHAHNVTFLEEKECLLVNMVRSLVSAIDSRDPYTCGHSERVALFARRLAQEIGFDDEGCHRIYLAGLLHDVGKIGVRDDVLNKTGPLTDEEFAEIKRHPEIGWSILHDLTPFSYVLPGVLHHHERIDGAGYPDGLCGEEIPIEGRLLAVVDAYDAMTSDRPYRKGMPHEKAQAILADGAGAQWDPRLVEAALRIMPEIAALRQRHGQENPSNRTANVERTGRDSATRFSLEYDRAP